MHFYCINMDCFLINSFGEVEQSTIQICNHHNCIYNVYIYIYICISYVTAVRYVAAINHEARGRAAPEGE